tara:strand:+ start:427 stop:873 length:447 start_codon:yes stop_codon:yes gene_type:complete
MLQLLEKMSKPDLVNLGRQYNKIYQIKGLHRLKRTDLVVALLVHQEELKRVLDLELPSMPKRVRKKKSKSDEENNSIMSEVAELTKQAMSTKSGAEKAKLMKEISKLQKTLSFAEEDTHTMLDGTEMSGKTHTADSKPVKKVKKSKKT